MKFEHRSVLELVQTQIISASPSHAPSHRYHFCLAKNTALSVLMPEMRSYPKKCPCTRCSSGLEVTPLPGWLLICLLTPGCALAWGDLGSIHEWQSSAQGWELLPLKGMVQPKSSPGSVCFQTFSLSSCHYPLCLGGLCSHPFSSSNISIHFTI